MKRHRACIENLINGYLNEAKKQAKQLVSTKLSDIMQDEYGFSTRKALRATAYLREPSGETFQAYCDEE